MEKEMVVALGCTEPAAVAYAAALAREAVGGKTVTVRVIASGNVLKNAMAVGIPGTPFTGMAYAACLGAIAGNPARKLAVLAGLSEADIDAARAFVEGSGVRISKSDSPKRLFIDVTVVTDRGAGRAVIEDEHDRVVLVEADGTVVMSAPHGSGDHAAENAAAALGIDGVFAFAEAVDLDRLGIVRKAIELNSEISRAGLAGDYGLRIGKMIKENVDLGILADDLLNAAMSKAAAGSDARMAGSSLPVMSNSGSGNQGIAATIPVLAVGERLGVPKDRILRAITLSNLMTIYIKSKFGRLSALCGAVVAGTGAACGITYLLGGGLVQVRSSVQNMIGNVSGMLCDGAKGDCALKISTCTAAAVQASLMAIRGITVGPIEGIVDADPDKSIDNLARLGNEGSPLMDGIILDMMTNKRPS
ncbi:MAG: L-serine ammonia-lyase, iron-sulfur-dependent, subunit alpha [Spirochaetes bacterium]|nr:L-serine ammonia-lyase, iron-sulfur-dependent, subunit alpha [Spirochaetota bacterium]